MNNARRHSRIDTERADAPFIETVDGVDALHKFADMTEQYRDVSGISMSLFLRNVVLLAFPLYIACQRRYLVDSFAFFRYIPQS